MSMHTNDLIADIYIVMQDGAKVTLNISQEPDKGGIIMTIGQLQNEIFKKVHVDPDDQVRNFSSFCPILLIILTLYTNNCFQYRLLSVNNFRSSSGKTTYGTHPSAWLKIKSYAILE